MNYSIKLDMNLDNGALQTLLRTLDAGPHGLMRQIIDNVIQQAQAQEKAAQEAQQADGTTERQLPQDAPVSMQ